MAGPHTRLRWIGVGGGVLLALLAVVAGWLIWRGPEVDAVVLQSAPLVRTLQFSARVATLSRVDVGSTLTARVAQVLAREGDEVRQGDVLLRLEDTELRAAQLQAQATQRQAVARLAGLRGAGRTQARAALAQADATLRLAQAELRRSAQLVAQGFVSEARLDEAQRALEVSRAQQASARAQWQAVDESGTELSQAQAQLALADAAVQAAGARLAQARVSAPADARVLQRHVEPGAIVQPGKALLTLALAGPTQLSAQVDERFLDQLRVGQTADVVADAFAARRFQARVLSIAPSVDAERGAIEVKLELSQDAPDFLREDMSLSVEVQTARREQALVMPLAALRTPAREDGSAATVLVAVDGHAQVRDVRLGLRTLDAAEVLDGLAEGDGVLLDKAISAGQRVRARVVPWQPGQGVRGPGEALDLGSALTSAMGR